MNNATLPPVKGGFRTRYHITPIDKDTGLPAGDTVIVCNLVLMQGYLALGEPTAYRSLSIGTNPIPPNFSQHGILTPIAKLNLEDAVFAQHVIDSEPVVFSTASFEFLFKEFLFPSNVKSIDLTEIGLDGVTRAVFAPVTVTRNNWVKVVMEVIYEYGVGAPKVFEYQPWGASHTAELKIITRPIVYNDKPNNRTGRGWGADRSILCYVWSGIDDDYSDKGVTTGLGITITPKLNKELYNWAFQLKLPRAATETTIPGLIIRDTVNGGAFLLRFTSAGDVFVLPEDGSMDLTFEFSWDPIKSNEPA